METGEAIVDIVVQDWWIFARGMECVKTVWKEQEGVAVKRAMLE